MILRSYERKFRTCEHFCENNFRKTLQMVLRSYETKFRTYEPGLNHNGFSTLQIVFGRNSSLPNIINDTLPALERAITSADLELHIATLYSAREAL